MNELLSKLEPHLTDHLTLNEGLSATEIDHLLTTGLGELRALVQTELEYLYAWHNGDRDYEKHWDGILAGYQFLPLEVVLEEYGNLLELNRQVGYQVWQSLWLPIFRFDGKQFCVLMLDQSAAIYEIFLEDGTPRLLFESLPQMLEVLITAYDRGVYQWRSEQGHAHLQVEEQGLAEIIRSVQSGNLASVLEKLQKVRTSAELEAIAPDLIRLKDPSFGPWLCQFLEADTDISLLVQVVHILAEIKPQSVLGKFHELLTTTDDYRLKLSLLNGLFSFADPETLTFLPKELADPDASTRSSAISVIHGICTKHPNIPIPADVTELLASHLSDPNLSLRIASASILVRLGHSLALDRLGELICHSNPVVRLQVLSSLAVCPDPKALSIVAGCLDDPDKNVQSTARHVHQALGRLQEL